MEQGVIYERKDDNSTGKVLAVCASDLDDIELAILDFDAEPYMSKETVTFTTVAFGGGHSPNVREALKQLADAIRKDNKENPIPEDFKRKKRERRLSCQKMKKGAPIVMP